MNEEIVFLIDEAEEGMNGAIIHLDKEFQKIRAGKASPAMLEGVRVDYYGAMTGIEQISNINTPDPRQIIVQPWEKNMLVPIEKAIMAANLGFNPQNNGEILRIAVPPLTEERRKDLVKKAKAEVESAKVTIRSIRRSAIDAGKKLEKDGASEDEIKQFEKEIQNLTDKFSDKVDKLFEHKERDIMTV